MSDLDPLTCYADEPTVEGGVHHPYAAWLQGWDAADAGFDREQNPYPELVDDDDPYPGRRRRWWFMGFDYDPDDDEWNDDDPTDQPPTETPPLSGSGSKRSGRSPRKDRPRRREDSPKRRRDTPVSSEAKIAPLDGENQPPERSRDFASNGRRVLGRG